MAPVPSASDREAARFHLAGVAKQLEHAEFLRASGRDDHTTVGWAITALFYCAVHVIRAYLTGVKGVTVSAHEDMHRCYREFPELTKTRAEYQLLKQESEAARYYLSDKFTWTDYDKLRSRLGKIEAVWNPKTKAAIGDDGGSAPAAPS
jgi:hypothetical protein